MPAIELLYRAALEFQPVRILVINAHAHALLVMLENQSTQLDLQQHFKPEYTAISNSDLPVSPGWPAISNTYELILILPAKNKQQTQGWMAAALNRLQKNGKIIVACSNHYGAKSYESALKQLTGHVSSRSKSKCRIFSTSNNGQLNTSLARLWLENASVRKIESHGLMAQPGLFSWDRPDTGSSLLIKHLPALSGVGMDLCCGYGLLAEHILQRSSDIPHIYLVEADRLALDCASQNTSTWQDKITYQWLNAATETLPTKLDWIVCNPPFHTGQQRDVKLGQQIIHAACQSLNKHGELWLVANRKLPYEHLLRSQLSHCQTMIEADGFKIIRGSK